MMKSYQTSGGTVLSTNWGEVADKDYEGKDRPSAPDGQEVTLSFHTPVTECWITNVALDTDAVKWVANNVAASGNVSVDLVYSTTVGDGRWLRS